MKATAIRLAPWVLFWALGSWAFGLPAFLAGAGLLGLSEGFQFMKERETMKGAHSIALAKRTDVVEDLLERMNACEAKVKELASPERLEAVKKLSEQFMRRIPGMGR